MKKQYRTVKKLSSSEDLDAVNAQVKAIQGGELDDAAKDKLCQQMVEDFLRRLSIRTQSDAKAVRDAEQALKVANAALADNLRVAEIIGGLLEPNEYEIQKNLGGKENENC